MSAVHDLVSIIYYYITRLGVPHLAPLLERAAVTYARTAKGYQNVDEFLYLRVWVLAKLKCNS